MSSSQNASEMPPPSGAPTDGVSGDAGYDDADFVRTDRALEEAVEELGLTDVAPAGSGLEFTVFRAWDPRRGEVAVRVPRYRTYRFPGRLPFSARRALDQERAICAHLHSLGFPVAEPLLQLETASGPVLVSRFLASERHGADSERIGVLLARLHLAAAPAIAPLDHDGHPVAEAMARRLCLRWTRLRDFLPELPPPDPMEHLARRLAPVAENPSLVHLDIRSCNLMSAGEEIVGLVDWSCAMLGHPAIELARSAEYSRLPENGIDFAALLAGYRSTAPLPALDGRVEALVRLDTVAMLGVIFFAYAPDPTRQEWVRGRVSDLLPRLCP